MDKLTELQDENERLRARVASLATQLAQLRLEYDKLLVENDPSLVTERLGYWTEELTPSGIL